MSAGKPRKRHVRVNSRIATFAGIRTVRRKGHPLRDKGLQRRDTGILWYCSVLCLSRAGLSVYAGPL